ncbi:DUF2243 domain-containing protein [Leptolyngbya sp. NK1-12]|uniref:DUF2243 domain-containing protein n=1 Tax=Leptolyngbya sp. NK1-12 TaxID=2547451 RepID=A0AA96WJS0_9CYAN|nr:DUF2243 domain-containing protein [Leptolyngbya sp. NK1-12]
MNTSPANRSPSDIQRRLVTTGLILGMGQAGFFDGIVLHQLLQWHHMFSGIKTDATVAGLELNTLGDGLFHLFDWFLLSLGITLMWQLVQLRVPLSTRTLLAAGVLGFGLFNLVEGLVDHQLLGIHHVKSGPHELAYDIGFLILNAIITASGWRLLRTSQKQTASSPQ